ncbi:MAG: fatty acid desaturase [Bacteroidia bacterium]
MNTYLILSLILVYITSGISASIIYHQTLSHKVIKLSPWFEKMMVLIALPIGTPVQWAGTHRQHHLYTDIEGDPHSPVLYGFWYAHCGWYISSKNPFICFLYAIAGIFRMFFDAFWRPRHRLEYNYLATDISSDKFYNAISKPINYTIIVFLYASLLCFLFYSLSGFYGLVWLWFILAIVYNLGDAINSIAHTYGKKLNDKLSVKNNHLLAQFTFGEGLHANHHHNPSLLTNTTSKFNLLNIILKIWKNLGLARFSN